MTKDDEIKALRELLTSVINDYDKTMSQMGFPRGETAAMYPLPPVAGWSFCPECGSDETRYEEGKHRQCANCH